MQLLQLLFPFSNIYIFYLAYASSVSAHIGHNFKSRNLSSDLDNVKGGLLLKNGKQTSCELGLIDNKSSYVSADCLDYNGSSVDNSMKYEVIIDAGINGKTERHTVEKIYVHPQYSSSTKANNLAIIQFNLDANLEWQNTIADLREYFWEDMVFVRRSLTDINKNTWGAPQVFSTRDVDDSVCSDMSAVYKTNVYDFTCTMKTAKSPSSLLSSCDVPYGSVYTYISGKLLFAGILSHSSVADGNSLCNSKQSRAYYTLASDYIFFAAKQTMRGMNFHPANSTLYPNLNADYAMKNPTGSSPSNTNIISGDFYANQKELSLQSQGNASDSGSKSDNNKNNDSDDTTDTVKNNNKDNDKDKDKENGKSNSNDEDEGADRDSDRNNDNVNGSTSKSMGISAASTGGSKAATPTHSVDKGLENLGSTIDAEDDSGDGDEERISANNSSKSSKTAAIAAAASILGLLFLSGAGYLLYVRWKRRHTRGKVDPVSQNAMYEIFSNSSENNDADNSQKIRFSEFDSRGSYLQSSQNNFSENIPTEVSTPTSLYWNNRRYL